MINFKKIPIFIWVIGVPFICGAQNNFPTDVNAESSPYISNDLGNVNYNLSTELNQDFFTGTANINIPFYKYNLDGIDLTVGMNYNTTGIKVDRIPSCIGLGWEFYYGGSITRQVRGFEDDTYIDNVNSESTNWFFDVTGPNSATLSSQGTGNVMPLHWRGYWNTQYQTTTTSDMAVDEEPDIFYASFGGRNIKFIIGRDGTVLTIPEMPGLQISKTSTNPINFTITDEQGNQFTFQPGSYIIYQNTSEYWRSLWTQWGANTCTLYLTGQGFLNVYGSWILTSPFTQIESWVLTKVQTYEGKIVNYNYNDKADLDWRPYRSSTLWELVGGGDFSEYRRPDFLKHKARLYSISFPNGVTLNFTYQANNPVGTPNTSTNFNNCTPSLASNSFYNAKDNNFNVHLSEIDIKETQSGAKYSYIFNQAYFGSPPVNTGIISSNYPPALEIPLSTPTPLSGATRLKLKYIDILGYDGVSTKNYYTFDYCPVPLPPAFLAGQDLYGFSNGNPAPTFANLLNMNDTSVVPLHTNTLPNNTMGYFGTDITPSNDVNIRAACALKSYKNGNGGQVTINYVLDNTHPVGQLLINDITFYDGYNHDNDIKKTYYYTNFEQFETNEGPISYNYTGTPPATYENIIPIGSPWVNVTSWKIWLNSTNILNTALNGSRYGYTRVYESIYNLGNAVKLNYYEYTGAMTTNPNGLNWWTAGNFGNNFLYGYYNIDNAPFTNKQYLRDWGIGLLTKVVSSNGQNHVNTVTQYEYDILTNNYYINSLNFSGTARLYTEKSYDINGFFPNAANISTTYYPITGKTLLTKKHVQEYYDDVHYVQKDETYYYNSYYDLINTTKMNSSLGLFETEKIYHNYDWVSPTAYSCPAIDQLNSDAIHRIIYKEKWNDYYGISSHSLTDLSVGGLSIINNSKIIRPTSLYNLATSSPMTGNPMIVSAAWLNMNSLSNGSTLSFLNKYATNIKYDNYGYIQEGTDKAASKYDAKITDHNTGKVLAEVKNARYNEIAYCGFESIYDNNPATTNSDPNRGNFIFATDHVVSTQKFLGSYSYSINNSNVVSPISNSGSLQVGKQYIMSFWIYQAANFSATDGANPIPNSNNTNPFVAVTTLNGWTLYKTTFYAMGGQISISNVSGDVYIDEIRLYPADGIMTSHNYSELLGTIADIDENDNVTFYDYDPFGNLSSVRDQKGNVVKKIVTVTQGND